MIFWIFNIHIYRWCYSSYDFNRDLDHLYIGILYCSVYLKWLCKDFLGVVFSSHSITWSIVDGDDFCTHSNIYDLDHSHFILNFSSWFYVFFSSAVWILVLVLNSIDYRIYHDDFVSDNYFSHFKINYLNVIRLCLNFFIVVVHRYSCWWFRPWSVSHHFLIWVYVHFEEVPFFWIVPSNVIHLDCTFSI